MQLGVGGFTLKTPMMNHLMRVWSDISGKLGRMIILFSALRAEHIEA